MSTDRRNQILPDSHGIELKLLIKGFPWPKLKLINPDLPV